MLFHDLRRNSALPSVPALSGGSPAVSGNAARGRRPAARLAVGGAADRAGTGPAACLRSVGFRGGRALLMPFGALDGIGLGCKVELATGARLSRSTAGSAGCINALGEPIDGKGPLPQGPRRLSAARPPPPAHARKRVQGKIDLGVRALNTFLTCCRGQRMGIFAGSGVGKSVLLSMIARYTAARRDGHRARRRARPRGAGIHRGRSRARKG